MSQFLGLVTSDAALVRCELDRVRERFTLDSGQVIGVGGWQDNQVVSRSYGVGVPRDEAWETPDSEMVLLASRKLPVGEGVEDSSQPFRFRRWLFAAVGELERGAAIRDRLREELPEFLQNAVPSAAWEAAAFARFLGELRNAGRMEDPALDAVMAGTCLTAAAKAVEQLSAAVGVTARPAFSFIASNGRVIAATARGGSAVSYTLLEGRAECARHELPADARDSQPIVKDHLRRRSVVIASGESNGWMKLNDGASLSVDRRLNVTLR